MEKIRNNLLLLLVVGLLTSLSTASADEKIVKDGQKVTIEYVLKIEGQVLDSSEANKPLVYEHGKGQIIAGLADALRGMRVLEEKHLVIEPDGAYGRVLTDAFVKYSKSVFPEDFKPEVGTVIEMKNPKAPEEPMVLGIIWEVSEEDVVVNFNHPLAGKSLEFDVKVVNIDDGILNSTFNEE